MWHKLWDKVKTTRFRLWYMLCFLLLGIIDQRRGSADGTVQMVFANCTGFAIAAMLFPSLVWERFRHKCYLWWTVICAILAPCACIWWRSFWLYKGQWITGVFNVVVWGYLVIYLIRERRRPEIARRLRQPFFWGIVALFLLMFLSVNEGIEPLWCLLLFGGFYLVGLPDRYREDFFQGMLNGFILWFFIQQTLAFGFRPYDYVRYRGLYSGETQSGIFYMIIYCAFLCKWIWVKEHGKSRLLVLLWFGLSGGAIGFLLFTGSRSSLVGVVVVTLLIYTIYDIIRKKSFYRWLLHLVALSLCLAISVPVVYGCIRYLPTILHHPVWFEGEYREEGSIRSFDPWDSSRYITFERAMDMNFGRILRMFGIRLGKNSDAHMSLPWVLTAHAEESSDPGSSPDNPFGLPGLDLQDSISIRKTIYAYYLQHLNWRGHRKSEQGFYLSSTTFYGHAHNTVLQVTYDHGIPAGVLYLVLTLYALGHFLICAVKQKNEHSWICLVFLTAVFCYGLTEYGAVAGMITWLLNYLLLYFAGEDQRTLHLPQKRGKSDD